MKKLFAIIFTIMTTFMVVNSSSAQVVEEIDKEAFASQIWTHQHGNTSNTYLLNLETGKMFCIKSIGERLIGIHQADLLFGGDFVNYDKTQCRISEVNGKFSVVYPDYGSFDLIPVKLEDLPYDSFKAFAKRGYLRVQCSTGSHAEIVSDPEEKAGVDEYLPVTAEDLRYFGGMWTDEGGITYVFEKNSSIVLVSSIPYADFYDECKLQGNIITGYKGGNIPLMKKGSDFYVQFGTIFVRIIKYR